MSVLSIDVGIRHLSFVVLKHQYNVSSNCIDITIEKDEENNYLWDNIDITPDKYNFKCNVPKIHQDKCKNKIKYIYYNNIDNTTTTLCEEHYINENCINIENCFNCSKVSKYYTMNEYGEIQFSCKKHLNNQYQVFEIKQCNYKTNIIYCNQPGVVIQNEHIFCQRHRCQSKSSTTNTTVIDRNKLQLEEIFKSMVHKLDHYLYKWKNVKTICIEKQPPKNPRMKSIMSSLQSYFIIRGTVDKTPLELDINNIHCIDAKNKLNIYEQNKKYPIVHYEKKKTKNAEYERRKYLSIKYTENILNTEQQYDEYEHLMTNSDKKDDLCDCYLQGRFYIETILGKKTINQNNQWNNYCDIKLTNIPKRFCFSDKVISKKKILNLMSLKYIINKYPFTKDNYENHLYKNQIINSINKYFGNINFFFDKIN